jgi:preprotein translocase subunit SecG
MYLFLTILVLIAALLLIFIVLVQNSKGGGLASGFSASNQVMGVRKTTDFLEKATWTLAGLICLMSVATVAFISDNKEAEKQSIIKEEVQNAVPADPNLTSPNFGDQGEAPAKTAATPAQAPAQTPTKAPAAPAK